MKLNPLRSLLYRLASLLGDPKRVVAKMERYATAK